MTGLQSLDIVLSCLVSEAKMPEAGLKPVFLLLTLLFQVQNKNHLIKHKYKGPCIFSFYWWIVWHVTAGWTPLNKPSVHFISGFYCFIFPAQSAQSGGERELHHLYYSYGEHRDSFNMISQGFWKQPACSCSMYVWIL